MNAILYWDKTGGRFFVRYPSANLTYVLAPSPATLPLTASPIVEADMDLLDEAESRKCASCGERASYFVYRDLRRTLGPSAVVRAGNAPGSADKFQQNPDFGLWKIELLQSRDWFRTNNPQIVEFAQRFCYVHALERAEALNGPAKTTRG